MRNLIEQDSDIYFTLLYAYDLFIGAFYAGPTSKMEYFQNLYHNSVIELYNHSVSDDDQHVYIRCYLKDPELFNLCIFNCWTQALIVFQKEDSVKN